MNTSLEMGSAGDNSGSDVGFSQNQSRLTPLIFAFCLLLGSDCADAAEVVVSVNPVTHMKTWQQSEQGISLEMLQLTQEAAEATYSSRDLSRLIYESMHGYCVFGSVVRNETNAALTYHVSDWRVVASDGKKQRLRTKSQWLADWKKKGVGFSWSILPDDLTLDVGDWSLGYTPIKLSPGENFDLIYTWRQNGKLFTNILRNLSCPAAQPVP